jgi:hypothetical protein
MTAEQLLDELKAILKVDDPGEILSVVRDRFEWAPLVSAKEGKLRIAQMTVNDAQAIQQGLAEGIGNAILRFQ